MVQYGRRHESGVCHMKNEASGSSQWPVTAHVSTRWPPPGNVMRDESSMGVKGSTYCSQEYSFITLNSKKSTPPGDGQGEGLRSTLTRGRIDDSVVLLSRRISRSPRDVRSPSSATSASAATASEINTEDLQVPRSHRRRLSQKAQHVKLIR